MTSSTTQDISKLTRKVRHLLLENADAIPFHSWSHTDFVRSKAVRFAKERGADVNLVAAAALVHDVNYIVKAGSGPDAGRSLRHELLSSCGFSRRDITRVESIITNAHTANRGRGVDVETACLSDADSLYKILPITPVLFSHRYLEENGLSLADLAKKILDEQYHKLEDGYYFYDADTSKRYSSWTATNLEFWEAVWESLSDPDVARLVEKERGC